MTVIQWDSVTVMTVIQWDSVTVMTDTVGQWYSDSTSVSYSDDCDTVGQWYYTVGQ